MTSQNRGMSQSSVSRDRAARALRELGDPVFSDVVLQEMRRRGVFDRVVGQIDAALTAAQARAGDPHRGGAGAAAVSPVSGRAGSVSSGSGPSGSRRSGSWPAASMPSAARGAVMQVPHVCSVEAGGILVRRGVLSGSDPADALRRFARDGRLIVLRGDRRWVYPSFQLDYFDPRDPINIICTVNRMLDAGHYAALATLWWTSPSGSLPGRRAPVDLLEDDHETLRQLAAAESAGPVVA